MGAQALKTLPLQLWHSFPPARVYSKVPEELRLMLGPTYPRVTPANTSPFTFQALPAQVPPPIWSEPQVSQLRPAH